MRGRPQCLVPVHPHRRRVRQRISTIGSKLRHRPRRLLRRPVAPDAAGVRRRCRGTTSPPSGPDLVAGQRVLDRREQLRRHRGGGLVLRLPQGDTPPSVELEIEDVTAGTVSGRLRVHGVTTCATPSVVQMQMTASQRVGSGVARGTRIRRSCRSAPPTPSTGSCGSTAETGWAFDPGLVALDVFAESGHDGFSRFPFSFGTNEEAQRARQQAGPPGRRSIPSRTELAQTEPEETTMRSLRAILVAAALAASFVLAPHAADAKPPRPPPRPWTARSPSPTRTPW